MSSTTGLANLSIKFTFHVTCGGREGAYVTYMSIITLVLVLAVVGFCLWLLLTYVPMVAPFKPIIIAIVAVGLLLWILDAAGIYSTRMFRL